MSTALRVFGFTLFLTLIFTAVTNLLPQVEGSAPEAVSVDIAGLDAEALAAVGERLFHGKGTCSLCHNDLGRAPDILASDMVETAALRLDDARYRGDAANAEDYIRESMADPDAFVVSGFGIKGSDDTRSPMFDVRRAPTELTEPEVTAIIAFLQAKDGHEISPTLLAYATEQNTADDSGEEDPVASDAAGPAVTALAVVEKYGCGACHTLPEYDSDIGPNLAAIGAKLSRDQIRQGILDPQATIADGFEDMMPNFFADEMSAGELEILVEYLSKLEG